MPQPRRYWDTDGYLRSLGTGKVIAISVGSVLLMSAVLVAWSTVYSWDASTNRGYTVGYWGAFNRVKQGLEAIPGTTITSWGCNADLTLEGFNFKVVVNGGPQIVIGFNEYDSRLALRGEAMQRMLEEQIALKVGMEALREPAGDDEAVAAPES